MKKLLLTVALVLFAFPFFEVSAQQKKCKNDSECGIGARGMQNMCFKGSCYHAP